MASVFAEKISAKATWIKSCPWYPRRYRQEPNCNRGVKRLYNKSRQRLMFNGSCSAPTYTVRKVLADFAVCIMYIASSVRNKLWLQTSFSTLIYCSMVMVTDRTILRFQTRKQQLKVCFICLLQNNNLPAHASYNMHIKTDQKELRRTQVCKKRFTRIVKRLLRKMRSYFLKNLSLYTFSFRMFFNFYLTS